MSDVTDATDRVIYEGSFTTDAGYPDRFVRDSFRYRLRAGILGHLLGIVSPAVIFAVLVPARDPLARVGAGLIALVVSAAISAGFAAFAYRWQLRKARQMIPPGSTYAVTLRHDRMSIRDWMISSDNAYGLWGSAQVLGDHVILRRADGGIYTPLARELFTPDAEKWLIGRVRAQNA
jgi:hypothetical protein